jgi:hypothetical protein
MTEKRFTIADGFKIVAIKDNGEIMNSRQVCNQLNEFCEENKELKSLCKVLIKHIDEKSIAFVIDEDVRRLLE